MWPVLIDSMSVSKCIDHMWCDDNLGFQRRCWWVSFATIVFVLICPCVFSHNVFILALLKLLSRCNTKNRWWNIEIQLLLVSFCTNNLLIYRQRNRHNWTEITDILTGILNILGSFPQFGVTPLHALTAGTTLLFRCSKQSFSPW